MARSYTKCSVCGDLLWFGDTEPVPQAVQCNCNATRLEESGPDGAWTEPTQEEIDSLP